MHEHLSLLMRVTGGVVWFGVASVCQCACACKYIYIYIYLHMYVSVYVCTCVSLCLCDFESGLSETCVNTRKKVNYA